MKPDLLKQTKHNLLINESDIAILKKYDIYVDNFLNISELIFKIEDVLSNDELSDEEADELDYISETLQERNYYQNTNK